MPLYDDTNMSQNYKKFLIQQYNVQGSSEVNVGSVVDTYDYNIVCQECPFMYLPESKELPAREWYDEHGDDVYIPTDGLRFKGYDLEVTFLYVGVGYVVGNTHVSKEDEMKQKVGRFIDFLYGRNDGGSPLLKIYDEYTLTGRKGVYVLSVDTSILAYDDKNDNVIGQFKVKFRVSDPVTKITLS